MAATIIDTLKIVAGMDARGVEQGMQKMQSTLDNGLKSIMMNFVGPLMGALSAGKLFADYTSKADAIGKMSAALDVDGEALQAWGEAASRAGGSAEGFNSSVSSLNKGIQQFMASGSGRLKEPLEALGLSQSALKDAQGNAKDVFEIMQTLADKAETMSKAKFAGIAERLGIDQGTVMLLQSGRRAVDDLVARQKSLGVYTKRDFEITAAFNDAVSDLGQVFRSVASIIMRVITPVITKFAEILTDVMMFLKRHEPFVLAFFAGIAAVMATKLLPVMYKMIAASVKFMMTPFGALIAVIAALALAFDDLYAYMQGGESLLADFWSLFGTGEEISAALAEAWEYLQKVFADLMAELKAKWQQFVTWAKPYVKAAFQKMAQFIQNVWPTVKAIFEKIVEFVRTAVEKIMALWERIRPFVERIFNAIVKIIGAAIDIIVPVISGAIDIICAVWEKIGPYVEAAFGFIVDVIEGAIGIITTVIETVADAVQWVADNIRGIWDGICGFMSDLWDNTVGWMYDKFMGFIDGVADAWNSVKEFFGFGDEEVPAPPPTTHIAQSGMKHGGSSGSFGGTYLPLGTSAAQSVHPATVSNRTNIDNDTTVNANITVQTQATDAQGIARGIGTAMENDFRSRDLVNIGNGGVIK